MRKNRITAIGTALIVLSQGYLAMPVFASNRDLPTATSGAIYSIIATIIGVPVKIATCAALGAIGGAAHGATLGESEFIQEEFLSALPDACYPVLKTTPPEIEPYLKGPQPREMQW